MHCMHEGFFNSQGLIVGAMRHNDGASTSRCYYVLNPECTHLPRVAILPPCKDRVWLVGHPSESIEAAPNRLLACFSISAYVAASSTVPLPPSALQSESIHHMAPSAAYYLIGHALRARITFCHSQCLLIDRRKEEAHMTMIVCRYPCM